MCRCVPPRIEPPPPLPPFCCCCTPASIVLLRPPGPAPPRGESPPKFRSLLRAWSDVAAAESAAVKDGFWRLPIRRPSWPSWRCEAARWARRAFSWTVLNLSRRSTQRIEFSSRDLSRAPVGRSKPGVEPALVGFRVSGCMVGVVKVEMDLQSWSSVKKTNVADAVQSVF